MADDVWKKILTPEERVEFEFTLSKKYLSFIQTSQFAVAFSCFLIGLFFFKIFHFVFHLLGTIFFILGFAFFLWGLIYPWYLKKSNRFAFTNKRFLILKGWFSTSLTSVDWEKITDVEVQQKFWEKILFNTGTLTVNTAGTSAPEIVISWVDDPYRLKAKLDEIKDKLEVRS